MRTQPLQTNPDAVGEYDLYNRTGIAASPDLAAAQAEAGQDFPDGPSFPDGPNDEQGLAAVRAIYEQEARPVGTMPPTMVELDEDEAEVPQVLLDKLSERCAFERSGVRLYEGLIGKLQNRGSFEGGPTEDELTRFMSEELAHFQLVATAMTALGGDPTAMSPCADVSAVATQGLVQVISDPRTTLAQALQAILVAELVDNDGWDMLVEICENTGQDDLVESFRIALVEEERHLEAVRTWLSAHAMLVAEDPELDAHGDGHVSPLS